jgi:hypothetical protein
MEGGLVMTERNIQYWKNGYRPTGKSLNIVEMVICHV